MRSAAQNVSREYEAWDGISSAVSRAAILMPLLSTLAGFSFLESYTNTIGVTFEIMSIEDVAYYSIICLAIMGAALVSLGVFLILVNLIFYRTNAIRIVANIFAVTVAPTFSMYGNFSRGDDITIEQALSLIVPAFILSIVLMYARRHPLNIFSPVLSGIYAPTRWGNNNSKSRNRRVFYIEYIRKAIWRWMGSGAPPRHHVVITRMATESIMLLFCYAMCAVGFSIAAGNMLGLAAMSSPYNLVKIDDPKLLPAGCGARVHITFVGTGGVVGHCSGNRPLQFLIRGPENFIFAMAAR